MKSLNYLAQINSFWDSATINPLSTGQVSLYFALLHINNRSNWTEWFTAPNQVLSILTGMSRSGISKARNELRQRGFIDFKERGTKATLYTFCMDTIANSKQVSVQDGVQDGVQNSNQNSAQDGVQNSSTLYKHKQKQNETEEIVPVQDINSMLDFDAEKAWMDTYAIYPKKSGEASAKVAWVQKLLPVLADNRKEVAVLIWHATKLYLMDYKRRSPDDTEFRYLPKYDKWLKEDCDYWIRIVENNRKEQA